MKQTVYRPSHHGWIKKLVIEEKRTKERKKEKRKKERNVTQKKEKKKKEKQAMISLQRMADERFIRD